MSKRNGHTIIYTTVLMTMLTSCGVKEQNVSEPKIVGGALVATDHAAYKHTVALVDSSGRQFCTGTLVTSTWVVTAAHCLQDYGEEPLFIAFGQKAVPGAFRADHLRSAIFVKVHEAYDEQAMAEAEATSPPADIAILILDKSAPPQFSPVPVLRLHNALHDGETLLLAGYGVTSGFGGGSGTLRMVETKLTKAASAAREIEFGQTPGKSACRGDSGGPAFVYRGNQVALVGVTSRGSYFCNDRGIYTDIRYYVDWLIASGKEGAAQAG